AETASAASASTLFVVVRSIVAVVRTRTGVVLAGVVLIAAILTVLAILVAPVALVVSLALVVALALIVPVALAAGTLVALL
ncbi:hypothetical protein QM646_49725, partial [Rhodococcus erythropolis]|nr:hypothetical protein [Rhodococcus erythropolis]